MDRLEIALLDAADQIRTSLKYGVRIGAGEHRSEEDAIVEIIGALCCLAVGIAVTASHDTHRIENDADRDIRPFSPDRLHAETMRKIGDVKRRHRRFH